MFFSAQRMTAPIFKVGLSCSVQVQISGNEAFLFLTHLSLLSQCQQGSVCPDMDSTYLKVWHDSVFRWSSSRVSYKGSQSSQRIKSPLGALPSVWGMDAEQLMSSSILLFLWSIFFLVQRGKIFTKHVINEYSSYLTYKLDSSCVPMYYIYISEYIYLCIWRTFIFTTHVHPNDKRTANTMKWTEDWSSHWTNEEIYLFIYRNIYTYGLVFLYKH